MIEALVISQVLALHYLGVKFKTVMASESDVDVAELLKCCHQYIGQPLRPEKFPFGYGHSTASVGRPVCWHKSVPRLLKRG
jgi:hypothetical protein